MEGINVGTKHDNQESLWASREAYAVIGREQKCSGFRSCLKAHEAHRGPQLPRQAVHGLPYRVAHLWCHTQAHTHRESPLVLGLPHKVAHLWDRAHKAIAPCGRRSQFCRCTSSRSQKHIQEGQQEETQFECRHAFRTTSVLALLFKAISVLAIEFKAIPDWLWSWLVGIVQGRWVQQGLAKEWQRESLETGPTHLLPLWPQVRIESHRPVSFLQCGRKVGDMQ